MPARHDAPSRRPRPWRAHRRRSVAVAGLALQRDEQIARLERARVDRHAGGGERRRPSCRRWPPAGRARSTARSCAAPTSRRTTLTSSNGMHRVADRLALLVALARHRQHVAGPSPFSASAIARSRSPISRAAGAGGQHRGADRGRVLAARIVVGDDGHVGEARGGGAHQRPLAAVAVAAGAEHHVQPARGMRAQRGQQPLQRVRACGRSRRRPRRRSAAAPPVPAGRARRAARPADPARRARRARWPAPRPPGRCRPGTGPAAAACTSRRDTCRPRCAAPGRRAAARPPAAGSPMPASPTVRRSSRRRARDHRPARASVAGIHVAAGHGRRAGRQQLGEQPQLGRAVGVLEPW